MSEPISVDFKRKRRVDSIRYLQEVATAVRLWLDMRGIYDAAVDVILPDPIRDRRPYVLVSMATPDVDIEEEIATKWSRTDFDFALVDEEDL